MTKQKALFQPVLLATAVLTATEVHNPPTLQHGTVRIPLEKNQYFKRKGGEQKHILKVHTKNL